MNDTVITQLNNIDSKLKYNYLFMFVFFLMTTIFVYFTYQAFVACYNTYSNYNRMITAATPVNTKSLLDSDEYPVSSSEDKYQSASYNGEIVAGLKTENEKADQKKPVTVNTIKKTPSTNKIDINTMSKDYDNYLNISSNPKEKNFWFYLFNPTNLYSFNLMNSLSNS